MSKVLFIIPYLTEGGAQRAVSNIQQHLPSEWDITTLVNSEAGKKYPTVGCLYSLFPKLRTVRTSLLEQIILFLKRVRTLREFRKTNEYDAFISFVDSANISNIISAMGKRGSRTKTIVSVRTSINEASRTILQYRLIVAPLAKLFYKRADLVVSVSEELKNELVKDYGVAGDKVVSIPNGFDIGDITEKSCKQLSESIKTKIDNRKIIFYIRKMNFSIF